MKKQIVGVVGTIVSVTYPSLGNKQVHVDYSILSAEMKLQAGLHGLKQKLGDAESGGSPAEKHAMASRIIAGLREGQWELTATPVDLTPIIIEAVSRIKKVKLEVIEKACKGQDAMVKQWAAAPKVKAEILKIRAERAAVVAEEADEDEIIVPGLK